MKLCASSRFPFVCLGDCGEVVTGSTPPKANANFWGGEIPFVTPAQLGFQPPITTADAYVTSEGADRGRLLPEGAVLVCCIGSLGKTGVAGVPLISNQQINAIIFDPRQVDARYGYYASRSLTPLLEHFAPSTTVKIVKKSAFAKFQIPLPPLAEQKRIAGILDAADALRAKRRESLAQLDTLLQSTFLDMFGDPVTNSMGFTIKALAEFYISKQEGTKCGPFGSALKKNELVASGVPVWNMDNIDPAGRMVLPFRMWITENKFRQLESYSVIDGDVIISRAGTVGKMCVANSGRAASIISTNLIRVRFGTELLPIYFVSLMTYCKGRVGRLKTGPDGAFTHMSTGVLDKLNFPYPPLDLQRRFAAIVESVEQQKVPQRAHLDELDTLFGSLQSRAFRGDL